MTDEVFVEQEPVTKPVAFEAPALVVERTPEQKEDDAFKVIVRRNMAWLTKEFDLRAQGHGDEARADKNP
jgi:hypothetical protein